MIFGWIRRLFGGRRVDYERDVVSPDGRLVAKFSLKGGKVGYEVRKDGRIIVRWSRLGFRFHGMPEMGQGLALVRVVTRSEDAQWESVVGEDRVVRNRYNAGTFYLVETGEMKRLLTVQFRVFDEGVAFRCAIPVQTQFRRVIVKEELTEFALDNNGQAWSIPAYQPDRYEYNYEKRGVGELQGSVHTPMTVETPQGYYVAVHEAALYNYGAMNLAREGAVLKADITPLSDGMKAYVDLPFEMPWRVIMVAEGATGLTSNRMIWNLNEPPRGDFSWVKPLKFLGIWWAMFVGEWTWARGENHGATTEHTLEYIDACVRLGVPGLLVEGWNDAWEGDWLQNGKFNKFMVPYPDFDPVRVTDYARQKGVSIIGHHETVGFVDNYEAQMEEAYKYLKGLGVNYVKSGYAGSKMEINGRREYHHSQLGVRHYQRALEMAAKYELCLDVHEPIKGTGIERTWPNLLTREGARGQEYEGGALSPSHACILPFTRMLAGGMDYTSGIFDVMNHNRRMATTLARQVAYFVTIWSGMQMVADRPRFYEGEFADFYEFVREVPVNWERSVPLLGEIGEYFVIARQGRDEDNWYVGGVTNEVGRRVEVALDFLEEGREYTATTFRDSDDAHYRDNQLGRQIERRRVRRGDRIEVYMAPGGGFGMALR